MVYCFQCKNCGATEDLVRPVADYDKDAPCSVCGTPMVRDFQAEHAGVRGDFKEPIVSDSMAFDAIDLAEHRKRFPNVDIQVEGRIARPILRSQGQRRAYLKGRGMVDRNSFT